jgi:hypothetical protein
MRIGKKKIKILQNYEGLKAFSNEKSKNGKVPRDLFAEFSKFVT